MSVVSLRNAARKIATAGQKSIQVGQPKPGQRQQHFEEKKRKPSIHERPRPQTQGFFSSGF
jgi:hypothetical protein